MAAHGRDIPTAVGVKHIRPANPVFAYLGDGAAYSIGMAETIHAALRNDNICVFVVNNSVFGMTGGQMAPPPCRTRRPRPPRRARIRPSTARSTSSTCSARWTLPIWHAVNWSDLPA